MKVVDLFCGAGGFSEGFKQAGFDIILGIDNWEPAVSTHQANHPNAKTIRMNVIDISTLTDDEFNDLIPDTEVIIGSPPCVSFSNSNKSGKAEKSDGINLINAFLRIVARKKWKKNSLLKYWILENVPNSRFFIKDLYTASDLGLSGDQILSVKNMTSEIYNASYFGVPSRRKRYFCGEFPQPIKTNGKESKLPLSYVLNALGDPFAKIGKFVIDPLYDFKMMGSEITDHHYLQIIPEYQWKTAKRFKQDKGYMGKMPFPENTSKPARTIMATMTFGARESMIFENTKGGFRAPTIREVASLMSFPISYIFCGKSIGIKYRLVGNAVPPRLSFAFARAILKNEGISQAKSPKVSYFKPSNDFINLNDKNIPIPVEKKKPENSRFKYHIPYLIINGFRVELTNHHSNFPSGLINWAVELHKDQGPRAKVYYPNITIEQLPIGNPSLITTLLFSLSPELNTFTKFQRIYCLPTHERESNNLLGPEELLQRVKEFIDSVADISYEYVPITINDQRVNIPTKIAIGYFMLSEIINEMRKICP